MPAPTYVDASHNTWYRLEATPDKWRADYEQSQGAADIVGYQETNSKKSRAVLKECATANGHAVYHPAGTSNAISWKKERFSVVSIDGKQIKGQHNTNPSAPAMGVDIKVTPGSDFTWVGLKDKVSGQTILRINTHAMAGVTKLESSPDARFKTAEANIFADWAFAQYWLDVVAFTAREMSRSVAPTKPKPDSLTRFWDIISIGGDYNAAMNNFDRWYYPAPMLAGLYVPDRQLTGLDHLQIAHGSDAKNGKRWTVNGHTDHRIHFIRRTIQNVTNQPRQK